MVSPVLRIALIGLVVSVSSVEPQNPLKSEQNITEPKRGWKIIRDPMAMLPIKVPNGDVHEIDGMRRNSFGELVEIQPRNPSYIVLAPTIARPDSIYQLVVGIVKSDAPVSVRAALVTTTGGREVGQAQVIINPGSMDTLKIKIPLEISSLVRKPSNRPKKNFAFNFFNDTAGYTGVSHTPAGLTLRVIGRKGSVVVFSNTTYVSTSSRFLSVLVQMSRPIYNGGQKIEFRIILLRMDHTPYQGPVDVYVLDTDGYVVRRWISRFPTIGIVQLSMGTPALPKTGWWRVRVVTAGQVDEHPFILTKYHTTRFEVYVDMPYYTLTSDKSVKGKFKAIFRTYMPVPGNATLTYSIRENNKKSYKEIAAQAVTYAEGNYHFELPMNVIRASTGDVNLQGLDVKVQVNFRHNFLGAVVKAYSSTRLIEPTVKVAFVGASPLVFKPGMSLTTAVGVSYQDEEPLELHRLRSSTLIVSPSVNLRSGSTINLPKVVVQPKEEDSIPWKEFLKDQMSYNRSIADEEMTYRLLQSYAYETSFARFRKEGLLEFTIDIPKDAANLLLSATYQDDIGMASGTTKGVPVHSPKKRYLHITSSTAQARVGEYAVFHVRSNFAMSEFQYMVMAKGIMIYSATEDVSWTGIEGVHTVSVVVAKEMSPRFTLVVVHITTDGEVVTDTIHVTVAMHNTMKTKMTINQHKDHSKRTVEAGMWAPAGSYYALSCGRMANYQLQVQHRITLARLMKAALIMEPHPKSVPTVKHRSRGGYWSEKLTTLSAQNTGTWALSALHVSGLALASDARIHHPTGTGMCNGKVGFLECGDSSCYRQDEVCDGIQHCRNGADEINCLTTRQYQDDLRKAGPVIRSQEILEAEFRLFHRNFLFDLFDKTDGGWCYRTKHIGHRGFEMLKLKVPNTPGKWLIEGYAVHPDHGLSILQEQPYDTTPPLMMKLEATSYCRRGEQISVRVHLFNPSDKSMMVMVILKGHRDYRFINVEENARVNYHRPRLSAGDHQHLITLAGGEFQEVMMPVAILKQMGTVIITIYALTQIGRDTRKVKVIVEPEGALVRYHTSVLLDLKNRATVYEFMDLPVDESPEIAKSILRRYVYGSPNARVAITGDVFGPIARDITVSHTKAFNGRILKSSDGYAFNFGTTLWSLHYLRLTNQLKMSEAKKAFEFLNVQLANLLARYKEGGFKMWFVSKSSVWMTSWVLSLLLSAQLEDWENLIYIEPKLINRAVMFLLKHQKNDGSFWEPASNVTHDFKMSFKGISSVAGDGERREESLTALTALITTVLHAAGPTLEGSVQAQAVSARLRATRFLERQLDRLWDAYDVAITTYALMVVGSPAKEAAIRILAAHAKIVGKLMHWSRSPISSNVRLRENNQRTFLLPKEPQEWDSYAVEATSYALLVFLTHEGVTWRTESIIEWLVSVRNWDFAYSSTLDTVLAYRAMAEYSFRARLRDITNVRVQVEITSRPGVQNTIKISNQSLASMNSLQVSRPWGHVYLIAQGSGQAVAQLETRWGVELDRFLKKPPRKYFSLDVRESYLSFRNKTVVSISVCTRWLATDLSPTSHAAFLEVVQPTGYIKNQADADRAIKHIRETALPHLMNVKTSARTMFFQFHYIPSDASSCFSYTLRRRHPIANHTSVRSATVFEQFAPEHFETTVINATPLAALDICEVCGSYQCSYCPTYSAASINPPKILHVVLANTFGIMLSLMLIFSSPPFLIT